MTLQPDDPLQAQAWISGEPPDQTIDFYIPRGNQGIEGPMGPMGPSLAVGTVETNMGGPVEGVIGPQGLTGPKGDPGGWAASTVLATGTNLNDVITSGLYLNPSSNAAAGPGNTGVGAHLEVISSANWVLQRYTTISEHREVYVRHRTSTPGWSAWAVITTSRVDQTAGRAIYAWDDVNNRDQLVYGDTGWREVPPAVGTAAWLRIRRLGNIVYIWAAAANLAATNPSDIMYVMPSGFRTGSNSVNSLIGRDGTAFCIFEVNLNGSFRAPFQGTVQRTTDYYCMVSYPTSESWPTSLPGTGVNAIPNL